METKRILTVMGLVFTLMLGAQNLVVNGDFEVQMPAETWRSDGTDWEVAYNLDKADQVGEAGEAAAGVDWCYAGDYGLRLKLDVGGNTEAVAHQDVAVSENTTYNYSFVARMDDPTAYNANSKAVVTLKNGTAKLALIGNNVVNGNRIDVTAQAWTVYSGSVTVPAGCTSVKINLYKGKLAGGTPAIYFDNFELEDTSVATSVENLSQTNVSVYPNPVVNNARITANTEIETLCIYNYAGKMLNSLSVNASTANVDFSSYDSGLFLIELKMAGGDVEVLRLIK